jgi:hypothetical protein
MRIVITARAGLVAGHEATLNRIVSILGAVSRNPSNPNFNQYTFETVSAFIRYVKVHTAAFFSNRNGLKLRCTGVSSLSSSL